MIVLNLRIIDGEFGLHHRSGPAMIVALLQQFRESMRGPRVDRRSSRSSASMVTSALHAADSTPSTLVRQFPRKQVAGTMIKADRPQGAKSIAKGEGVDNALSFHHFRSLGSAMPFI